MRAILNGTERSDIKAGAGYECFPAFSTRLDLLRKAPKTGAALACPSNVWFYIVIFCGVRHERTASPSPSPPHVGRRFGFWYEVEVS
jgi:hypothetical protein